MRTIFFRFHKKSEIMWCLSFSIWFRVEEIGIDEYIKQEVLSQDLRVESDMVRSRPWSLAIRCSRVGQSKCQEPCPTLIQSAGCGQWVPVGKVSNAPPNMGLCPVGEAQTTFE